MRRTFAKVLFLGGRPVEAEEAAREAIALFERRGNIAFVRQTREMLAAMG